MEENQEIVFSNHGVYRARKRLGLSKKAIKRLPEHLKTRGLQLDDTSGELRGWMEEKITYSSALHHADAHYTAYIYNNRIFILADCVVVTVLEVPSTFHSSIKRALDKKKQQ